MAVTNTDVLLMHSVHVGVSNHLAGMVEYSMDRL